MKYFDEVFWWSENNPRYTIIIEKYAHDKVWSFCTFLKREIHHYFVKVSGRLMEEILIGLLPYFFDSFSIVKVI